jgi:hypothetical protein
MSSRLIALFIAIALGASPAAVFAQTVTNTTTGGASQTAPTSTVISFGGPANIAGASVGTAAALLGGGLLPLPGFFAVPNNFSQPYKPDTFVNGPKFLPDTMTLEQADACRGGSVKWYGARQDEVASITLYYAGVSQIPGGTATMANYVGTATAAGVDRPFLTVLCEAAYKAMKQGASVAMVNSAIRPTNKMFGLGFGASGGGSGVPQATAVNPYTLAGVLGFGTGWSSQKVEGEILVELTGLRGGSPARRSQAAPAPGQLMPVSGLPEDIRLPEPARMAIKADCGGMQGMSFGACQGQ